MLLWQEIWSISCRVSPSYSISTTANNHQLGSAPDHLSLGNKEGDNSQWEAFYLKSVALSGISSLRLPATFLDTSRLFRRKDGHFAFTDCAVRGFLLFDWFTVTSQCDRPGLCFQASSSLSCLTSRQETWKTYQSHLSYHIISRRQLLSNNCFLLTLLYGW